MHFANLEAPPTWFIKTRPPEFDATIRRYEIERDALDPDVQNLCGAGAVVRRPVDW